jgi:Tfp pilus assembly protein PilV
MVNASRQKHLVNLAEKVFMRTSFLSAQPRRATWLPKTSNLTPPAGPDTTEDGFSLIEVSVAMIVLFVVLLGVAATINYAIQYNAGNNSRAQSLDALQQEVERMRSAKFTPGTTDAVLQGGSTVRTVTVPQNEPDPAKRIDFTVTTDIDNDPATAVIDTEAQIPVTSLKEITITARRADGRNDWTTAVPSRVVMRRVKSN